MSFFRRLFGKRRTANETPIQRAVRQTMDSSFRKCTFETMEIRRVLSANPLVVGAVYIEGDGGTDAEPDQFYISFEGGSAATSVTQIVIDGNQDGQAALGDTDVYFDTIANNVAGNQLGVGGAHGFEWSANSIGISAGEVTATVADGGTRLVLDLSGFEAGDVLAFSIDVDQYFSSKPHDQVTSGIEFAGSSLAVSVIDANYSFSPDPSIVVGTFAYDFDFGSDDVADTGTLSGLPSQFNRTSSNGFNSIENRTAGARQDFVLSPKPISISGKVYHDVDRDVQFDSSESGIENVLLTLQLKDNNGNWVDIPHNGQSTLTTTTNAAGDYSFGTQLGLLPGTYRVVETQPADWISSGASVGLVNGSASGSIDGTDILAEIEIPLGDQHGIEYNFGEYKTVAISGHVGLSDANGNCVDPLTPGYRGIGGVEIVAMDQAGTQFTTVTNADGFYEFTDLLPGTYTVIETQPIAYLDGDETVGMVNGQTRGGLGGNDQFVNIVLTAGEEGVQYNFCEHEPVSLAGTVYYDRNDNGFQDVGETGIAGVAIELFDQAGNRVASTLTDGDGDYSFNRLAAGIYSIVETQPQAYLDGKDVVGTVNGLITGSKTNDRFHSIELRPGNQGVDYDFGEIRPAILEGRVHTDLNDNCELDAPGEMGLGNVLMQLLDSNGNVVQETRTNSEGEYRFENLFPGSYSVRQVQPGDYFSSGETVGVFNYTGSAGDGVATENLISDITILSGAHMLDYNFCESPAATISGFVFQDGTAIELREGESLTESQAAALRDGKLTNDDTRLAGVVLELRDGITGDPILGTAALPGIYGAGRIQTTTDSNGFYSFTGLRQGNYAVFEIQPDGYRDHVDTAGTNLGIPINPSDSVDPFILSTLSAGVDPANDAILRIAVNWGDSAELNNFSEIVTTTTTDPPTNPPPVNPPINPRGQISRGYVSSSVVRGTPGSNAPVPVGGLAAPPSGANAHSWHLSIINGGSPRGDRNMDTQWNNISYLSESAWSRVDMSAGTWQISTQDTHAIADTPLVSTVVFGMDGGTPLAGDFNGDGTDELVMFRDGYWFVDFNGNQKWDDADLWAELGGKGDVPVVGDWDGDGKDDIGIYGAQWPNDLRAINVDPGLPDLSNDLTGTAKNLPPLPEDAAVGNRKIKLRADGKARMDIVDHVFQYGDHQDQPVTGDWNGDGVRNIGVFRGGQWTLDSNGDGRLTSDDQKIQFGQAGDIPVVGDFNGDGVEQVGIFRNGTWKIDSDGDGELTATDKVFEMGTAGDRPVVGDFDGDGIDEPATYRPVNPGSLKKAG